MEEDTDKPILNDYILQAVSDCLKGMKRVDYEFKNWKVKAYWAGQIMRVDISCDDWNQE